MTMSELFELFAKVTSKYLELTRDPDTAPCMRAWRSIGLVAQEHGFVLLTEPQYEYMVKRSKESPMSMSKPMSRQDLE